MPGEGKALREQTATNALLQGCTRPKRNVGRCMPETDKNELRGLGHENKQRYPN